MSTKNKFGTIQDFIDLFTRLKDKYSAEENVMFSCQEDQLSVVSVRFEQKEYEPEFTDPEDGEWYDNSRGVIIELDITDNLS